MHAPVCKSYAGPAAQGSGLCRTAEKSTLDEYSLYSHSDLQGFQPSGEHGACQVM